MKYKIVWIDDSRQWVESIEEEVRDLFEEKNFIVEVNKFQDVESARSVILDNYTDLIIIDYGLPNTKGDVFINELRESRCFAHVVFYSQDFKNVQVLEEDKHFLHVTDRDSVNEIMEEVADQAFRKYHHPAFMRGLLLSEFIDLENIMEDFIAKCFDDKEDYFKTSIIQKGGESFSLMAKLKFILRIIKENKKNEAFTEALDSIGFTSSQFDKNIIKRRNVLAHAYPEYSMDTGKITLKDSFLNIEFDGDWFHETREHIHEQKYKVKQIQGLNLR